MQLDSILRSAEGYQLARTAIEAMAAQNVWPTPTNFEIWLNLITEPQGELARALAPSGAPTGGLTEGEAEQLAADHLPQYRLARAVGTAGEALQRELESVGASVTAAQESSRVYGESLAEASRRLTAEASETDLSDLVGGLGLVTRAAQQSNQALKQRLDASKAEVERLRAELDAARKLTMTDGLTGLPNRRAFDTLLAETLGAAEATGATVCLALADIDHFKAFNDTWGHQTGDSVLRYVATIIGEQASGARRAARYGGEEFALVFQDEPLETVAAALEALRTQICSRSLRRRTSNEDLGVVSVSLGLAVHAPGEGAEALISRADAALYAAKKAGRNRVVAATT